MWDLTRAINQVLNTSNLTDPREIAEKIADDVPATILRAVLREALVHNVRAFITQHRARDAEDVGSVASLQPKRVPASNRSAKVAAIREAAPRWLQDRISTRDGWKFIADCTVADMRHAADQRRRIAGQIERAATRFDALADQMERCNVSYVRDLPHALLRQLQSTQRIAR